MAETDGLNLSVREQPCKSRVPITGNEALGFERITFIHTHHGVYEICIGDKRNPPQTLRYRLFGHTSHAIRCYKQLSDGPSIN